jgi:hypothetical protein
LKRWREAMLFNVAVAVVARRKTRRTGRGVKPVCSDTDMLMDSVRPRMPLGDDYPARSFRGKKGKSGQAA